MERITRRLYTDGLTAQAIALAEWIGRAKVARQLGMPVQTPGNWS